MKVPVWLSAGGASALLVLTLATRWYGVVQLSGSAFRAGSQSAAGGWQELGAVRWLIVVTVAVALLGALLERVELARSIRQRAGICVGALGGLTALALIYRVLVSPPSAPSVVDIKLGAFLAVLSACAVATGGLAAFREAR
jgi:hypothetical protein